MTNIVVAVLLMFSTGVCPAGEFACEDDSGCIPQEYVCDFGEINCADDSDELNCGKFAAGGMLVWFAV